MIRAHGIDWGVRGICVIQFGCVSTINTKGDVSNYYEMRDIVSADHLSCSHPLVSVSTSGRDHNREMYLAECGD